MIHQMSRQITRSLVDNDIIQFDDVSVCQYGLEVFLVSAIEILGLIILALITGYIAEVGLFILAFSSVRIYAGGYHAKTVMRCFALIVLFVASDIAFCKYIHIENAPWLISTISLISLGMIYRYSPVSVINRPISEKERIRFRKISLNLSIIFFIVINVMVYLDLHLWYVGIFSIGLFFEALTLLYEKHRKEITK